MKQEEMTYIIGHKNPDTDSICSAIAYADLKNRTEHGTFIAKRAGRISEETEYVLKYFEVDAPGYLRDVGTEVKEIEIHEIESADRELTVRRAWDAMMKQNVVTLPITDDDHHLEGLITVSDIAKSYMDIYDSDILSQAQTSFGSIAETLDGEIIAGDRERLFDHGRVVVGAFHPDTMGTFIRQDDLVIMGNRPEDLLCAIEMKVGGIVVGLDAKISDLIVRLAKEQNCVIISTPHDTYTSARLINQSLPIRRLMRKDHLVTFHLTDKVRDVRDVMKNTRHRDFPVLDQEECYVGTISRRNLIGCRGKRLILVDHNEKSQAVDSIEEAEILEILDHHRLGSLETMNPILFRNEPVGCTATIIYTIYQEKAVEIPSKIAGLLCSAILSDTLMFRSPTCTARDRIAAQALAGIAGIEDLETYAKQMFRAGSDIQGKAPREILYQDFKRFNVDNVSLGVGQISSMDEEELAEVREQLAGIMEQSLAEQHIDMLFFMLTNILTQSTELMFCGKGAKELLEQMTSQEIRGGTVSLCNVVSRKKQLIPEIMTTLQNQ